MLWDLFCRVVDNHGDIGVCWRLAADLASRGERVRLWVDDASALAWMAPAGTPNVEVGDWNGATVWPEPGDVVVETFGCELPEAFVAAMAARTPAPCWINLEYLSAEGYVERCHGLPSPVSSGPGAGLVKRFYYPGFTAATGGLIREPAQASERAAFDRSAWLEGMRLRPLPGERVVALFCYENPSLPALLEALATQPTLLIATAGLAAEQVHRELGASMQHGALRAVALPHVNQRAFDHLLWSADLNLVRGEDSFVRAQWAGVPFVWQAYPQHDGAHAAKVEAFLERHLAAAPTDLARSVRTLWRGWNGLGALPGAAAWPELQAWGAHTRAWRDGLGAQPDLVTQLLRFVTRAG